MCAANTDVRFGPKADIESSNLGQQPSPARYKSNPCNSRRKPTRHHLFDQHQCRKGSDPKEIHDTGDKQEHHQGPAAADAIKTVAKAERQGARRLVAKPITKDKPDSPFAIDGAIGPRSNQRECPLLTQSGASRSPMSRRALPKRYPGPKFPSLINVSPTRVWSRFYQQG